METTSEFYSSSLVPWVDEGRVVSSLHPLFLKPSYREPLGERELAGKVMPLRKSKVLPSDFDYLVLTDSASRKSGVTAYPASLENSVNDHLSYLLKYRGVAIPHVNAEKIWNGVAREAKKVSLLCEATDPDTSSDTSSDYDDYMEALANAKKEYDDEGDRIKKEYDDSYNEAKARQKGEKDALDSEIGEYDQDMADRESREMEEYQSKVKAIGEKEITDEYTSEDRQREYDGAEREHQAKLYAIRCDPILHSGSVKEERLSVRHADELDRLSYNRDASYHNAKVAYDAECEAALEKYNAKLVENDPGFLIDIRKGDVQKEYEGLFLPVSCAKAIWQRIGIAPTMNMNDSVPPPLFGCDKITVRSMMAKFADLEGTKLQPITVADAGREGAGTKKTSWTEHEDGDTNSDSSDEKIEGGWNYLYEYEKTTDKYGNYREVETKTTMEKASVSVANARFPLGVVKRLVSDVLLTVTITYDKRYESSKRTTKVYHGRVEWAKGETVTAEGAMRLMSDYQSALNELDKKRIGEIEALFVQLWNDWQSLNAELEDGISKLRRQTDDDISGLRRSLFTQVGSLAETYDSRIAASSDEKERRSLLYELSAKASELEKQTRDDIADLESAYDSAVSERRKETSDKFYEKSDGYRNAVQKIDERYADLKAKEKDAYKGKWEALGEDDRNPHELWKLNVKSLLDGVMEHPEPLTTRYEDGSSYAHVSCEASIEYKNFTAECDWRYLTGRDFSEYYGIAQEEWDKRQKALPLLP